MTMEIEKPVWIHPELILQQSEAKYGAEEYAEIVEQCKLMDHLLDSFQKERVVTVGKFSQLRMMFVVFCPECEVEHEAQAL